MHGFASWFDVEFADIPDHQTAPVKLSTSPNHPWVNQSILIITLLFIELFWITTIVSFKSAGIMWMKHTYMYYVYTVHHESFKTEKFCGFRTFCIWKFKMVQF